MYPMFVCVCIYIYITYIYTHTPLYLVRVHIMYLFAVSPAPALSLSAAVDERADIKRIVRARSPPPPFAPPTDGKRRVSFSGRRDETRCTRVLLSCGKFENFGPIREFRIRMAALNHLNPFNDHSIDTWP